MRNLLDLTRKYLIDPRAAGLNPRQTAKLEQSLVRAQLALGWSRRDTIEYILSLAVLRLRHGKPTLYISNIGSSGSHWLNAMLKEGIGLLGTGEIYVPLSFLNKKIAPLAAPGKAAFLQAVYLAHLMSGKAGDLDSHVSNTAHLADPSLYAGNDIASVKILLVRDPVDIVLSRTMRKPEYRAYLGQDTASDTDYLRDNIRLVDRFFVNVRPESYDLVCRYEDLLRDPVAILESIARLLEVAVDRARLHAVAVRRSRAPADSEAGTAGQLEDLRQIATRELEEARRKLAYA